MLEDYHPLSFVYNQATRLNYCPNWVEISAGISSKVLQKVHFYTGNPSIVFKL